MFKCLGIVLAIFMSQIALAEPDSFDSRSIRAEVSDQLAHGDLHVQAAKAFDAMFRRAEQELVKTGRAHMAEELDREWQTKGQGLLLSIGRMGDMGDHEPFSLWIQEKYQILEDALGVKVMEATHLRDIYVANYSIPVVFHAKESSPWCLETVEQRPADSCQAEYRRHFAGTRWAKDPDPLARDILHHGFAGILAYWAVYAGCEVATQGAGTLICGPAGDLAEAAIERYVAPGVSDRLFDRANAQSYASAGICPCCDCPCDACQCGADCPCCRAGCPCDDGSQDRPSCYGCDEDPAAADCAQCEGIYALPAGQKDDDKRE